MLFIQGLYVICVTALLVYGFNNVVMLWLSSRRYQRVTQEQTLFIQTHQDLDWPVLTTQIPVYNEANVLQRCLEAVCQMDYPQERHFIQVLDDSNDDSAPLLDLWVKQWIEQGVNLEVIRREHRQGFKAGALRDAHHSIKGEYLVMFDADFVPPKNFLKQSIPFLAKREKLGFVQARWGHLNAQDSKLTLAQSMGIDGHFMVEQSARCWNGLFLNFNGTAGVWRKSAIEKAGGWSADTLTEDMDLSYRVQLAGYHAEYLPQVVAPAEIPADVKAFKSQQFRWAKGSTQCAIKLLPRIFKKEGLCFASIQSFLHMSHYVVHPLMLCLLILSFPVVTWGSWPDGGRFILAALLLCSMSMTNMMYIQAQKMSQGLSLWSCLKTLPWLMGLGVGVALNNSRAVLEAVIGKPSAFVRTPKVGEERIVHYQSKFSKWVWLEVLLGLYAVFVLALRCQEMNWLSPFLAIHGLGFLGVSMLTLKQEMHERSWGRTV